MNKYLFLIIVTGMVCLQIISGMDKGNNSSYESEISRKYEKTLNTEYLHKVVVFDTDNRDTATGNGYGTLLCYPQEDNEINQPLQIGTATVLDVNAGAKGEVITTAEHVLKNKATGEINNCYFFPDRDISRYIDNKIKVIHPVFGGYTETGNREQDWAVAIIDRKVTTGVAGTHTLKYLTDFDVNKEDVYLTMNHDFGILAYDLDYKDIAISINCRVYPHTYSDFTRNHPMLYVTDCDAKSGSSGGALLYATPAGVSAIGIYIGSFSAPGLYPHDRYPEGPPNGISFDKDGAVNVVVKYNGNKKLLDAIESRVLLTR